MNVLYLGSLYPISLLEQMINSGVTVDFAAHTFQKALLSGFDDYYNDIKTISSPPIPSLSRTKQIWYCRSLFSHNEKQKKDDVFLGIVNIPLWKMFSEFIRARKEIKISLTNKEIDIIYIYSVHSPFLAAVATSKHNHSKVCLVVPDLPEFMSGSRNIFYRFAKWIDHFIINYYLRSIDCFVLLSPLMREKLAIGNKPWIQVEGIYCQFGNNYSVPKASHKTILYTGNISNRYGIPDLLEAFSRIAKPNYRLWLLGQGDALDLVNKYAKNDSRIVYMGVRLKEEIATFQRQATLLINPRHSFEVFTKYSFPSKTLEYMASGTPTLMSPLECLPDEYKKHLFLFDDESIEGMKSKIMEICEMPQEQLDSFGDKAAQFIFSKKNATFQAKKIVDLVNSLLINTCPSPTTKFS